MKVQSNIISDIDYDEAEKELTVTFNKGGTYKYFDVPVEVWNAFNDVESKGKYFLSFIKNQYKTEKL